MTSIYRLRKNIDSEGFVILGTGVDLTGSEIITAEELMRLGYERLYVSDSGRVITVFGAPGKTPGDALAWYLASDIIKTANLETPYSVLDVDTDSETLHLHIAEWFSVYKGVGGGRWTVIAIVDTLQTAQTLLNTMETGKVKHGDVQIEVKNPHLNDN